jgi:hypothetical protein
MPAKLITAGSQLDVERYRSRGRGEFTTPSKAEARMTTHTWYRLKA